MFLHRALAAAAMLLVLWTAIRARTGDGRTRGPGATLDDRPRPVRRADDGGRGQRVDPAQALGRRGTRGAVRVDLGHGGRARHDGEAREGGTGHRGRCRPGCRGRPDRARTARRSATRVTAYYRLTKPRIVLLLLITTVPAMLLAARGLPSPWLILATLTGGAIAAGSANSINMYLDRDIDAIMRRTRQRPLPSHAIAPEHALRFGFVLGAIAFYFLAVTVNVLAAVLAAVGDRVLRLRLHDVAQAHDVAEHRDRRRGRRRARARRMGRRHRARSRGPRSCCSRSCSSGRRRTSGRWRCASPATTRRRASRCSRSSAARPRRGGRSSCIRSCCSRRRCCSCRSATWGRCTRALPCCSAARSSIASLQVWRTADDARTRRLFSFSILYLAGLFGAVGADALLHV